MERRSLWQRRHKCSLLCIAFSVAFTVSGCRSRKVELDRSSRFDEMERGIKARLRDPDSAQFRSEAIRTLWSTSGKRITVFCAELNANNGFGGKTGYQGVRYYVATKGLGYYSQFYRPGSVAEFPDFNANYYLECVRPDTQRADDLMGKSILFAGSMTPSEVDQEYPALSNRTVPDN